MNLYSITFAGYYPVGAVAVVCADSPDTAAKMLHDSLSALGLCRNQHNTLEQLTEACKLLDNSNPRVHILLTGDY